MINTKLIDNYFKFLFFVFLANNWYELVFVSDPFIKSTLVTLYCVITLTYILIIMFFNKNIKSLTLYYRISTLTAFISTLFSLIYPTNLLFLSFKVIFIFMYLYISYTKLFKYKIEEGLVGILASLLLLVIMFRY